MLASAFSAWLALQLATGRTALAVVVGPQNQRITAVDPDDILVRERGESRDVLAVRIADYPVVLLLDDSPAGEREFDAMRRAALRFIARVGERPVAIGTLTRPDALITTFDDGRPGAARALMSLMPRAAAPATLASIGRAARAIHDAGAQFSAIVVMSAAAVSPDSEGTADGSIGDIIQSGATIHVVAARPPGQQAPRDVVRELSEQTRGRFTTIYSPASFQAALDRFADDLATEILIDYLAGTGTNVPPAADITLGVRVPGVRVLGLGVR